MDLSKIYGEIITDCYLLYKYHIAAKITYVFVYDFELID